MDNPTLVLILADIALIIGSARLAGTLFARFGQPPVIGEHTGVFLLARYFCMDRPEAGALGWLMNTRGLTELIILNVGLKLNVISPTVFTLFVIMALATTVMAAPMMKRVVTGANIVTTASGARD